MGEALIERTETVIATVVKFLPDDLKYIFVSEYRDEEGNRAYESLWLLTESVMSEAHHFVTATSFDLCQTHHGVSRVLIEAEEFDFEQASERSRLNVNINFGSPGVPAVGEFKASGSNCSDLQEVIEEYLVPLLPVSD